MRKLLFIIGILLSVAVAAQDDQLKVNPFTGELDYTRQKEFDSIRVVGDTIAYFYIDGNVFASDTLSGVSNLSAKIDTLYELKPNSGGNARGLNAIDFQFNRASDDQVAAGVQSFIAGGRNNKIAPVVKRAKVPNYSHAEGYACQVLDWQGHAEGTACIADGKISHAEGNTCICVGNDAHAEGNRTFAGGRYYETVTTGSEDAGDGLGVKQFVLIDDDEGDVSSFFPNPLTDNITTRYGAGAQLDIKGNIYTSGNTPATWTGDVPTTLNDLTWALHSSCYVRGPSETDISRVDICKSTYASGTGTKVYYDGAMPYASLIGIYSSYAPQVEVDGNKGGNGQHSEGRLNSAYGDGAHVEGGNSRAWGQYSHAEGKQCYALATSSHAEGHETKATAIYSRSAGVGTTASGIGSKTSGGFNIASGDWSMADGYLTEANARAAHAKGEGTVASGTHSHAEGDGSIASGENSHAEGDGSIASGENSHAEGLNTEAAGDNSKAFGKESKALRDNEQAYAAGKRVVVGDDQTIRVTYSRTVVDVGWWEISVLEEVEDGKAYHFETMVMGRQIAGTGGVVGNTFAYKFNGCITRDGAVYTTLSPVTRTLIARSAGMSGDGLTTGERMYGGHGDNAKSSLFLQYGGVINQTYRIQTHSWIQEIKIE